MEFLLVVGVVSVAIYFLSTYSKRKNDMRLMAKILTDREGREERWKKEVELDLALGDPDGIDIRDLHKERLESEERFIEYFRDKYGTTKT
jgi:allophanate hydrolase subunit 1